MLNRQERLLRPSGPGQPSAGSLFKYVLDDWKCRKYIWPTRIERELCHRLRRLCPRQSVIHCTVQVIGQLRDLAGGNQRADRDETAVAGRKTWSQPQVVEQYVPGELNDSGRDGAEVLLHCAFAPGFCRLVEREKVNRRRRELRRRNATSFENGVRDIRRRGRIGPTGVERQMRDDFRNLSRLEATVEREIELERQLCALIARNQYREGDYAAIPSGKLRTFPQVAQHHIVRIALKGG